MYMCEHVYTVVGVCVCICVGVVARMCNKGCVGVVYVWVWGNRGSGTGDDLDASCTSSGSRTWMEPRGERRPSTRAIE